MEEYEIRDVSHRSSGPILSISFRLEDDSVVKVEKARSVRRVKIMPLITNESPAPAEYITINIYVDRDVFKLHGNHELKKMPEEKEFFVDENTKQCHRLHMNHTIQKGIPIFEGSPFRLLNDPITIDIDHDGDYFMAYTLLAPYMSEVFGAAVLQVSREGAVIQGFTSATE
jgi:hypothetical protein